MNPWVDLITMAKSWCLMKPGGIALVGFPSGPDKIDFNGRRTYGRVQLPHVFSNWEQLYAETNFTQPSSCSFCNLPLIVVRKPNKI